MNWIDEQIKQRAARDDAALGDALSRLASVIQPPRAPFTPINASKANYVATLHEILRFYGVDQEILSKEHQDLNRMLTEEMHPHGILHRQIRLKPGFSRNTSGPILATLLSGQAVALLPHGSGLRYYDSAQMKYVKLNKKREQLLSREAYCFYAPLPARTLSMGDLLLFMAHCLSRLDVISLLALALATTALGSALPLMNTVIFAKVVSLRQIQLLPVLAVVLLCVLLGQTLIGTARCLMEGRVAIKLSTALENAVMARALYLPLPFFERHSAGEVTSIFMKLKTSFKIIGEFGLTLLLTASFSAVYILLIAYLAPPLVGTALIAFLANALILALAICAKERSTAKVLAQDTKISGLVFSVISGIQKIRLAGAQRRIMSRWANAYEKKAAQEFHPPLLAVLAKPLIVFVNALCIALSFLLASRADLNVSSYMGFAAAFTLLNSAFFQLASVLPNIASIRPAFRMLRPLLEQTPENAKKQLRVATVNGRIEMDNVTFRYHEDGPAIINNLNLSIRPGEYIGIVGESGCGKSTLFRLLLGGVFPEKGSIYYDGKDLNKLDIKSLRNQIGIVMQNSQVFSGDIYSNIVIGAPWLTLSDAWEAAEIAGIAEDIRAMPMGMHTMISERGGSISGGQRQRIIIARALVKKPKILLMDEATSALDNITQQRIACALAAFRGTRIVIAHRLSTVLPCDRILVLNRGSIEDEGDFDTLMKKDGLFAQLAKRQML